MPFGELIIIGAVALFIILRYRSVLGEKTGHDFSKPKRPDTPEAERVVKIDGTKLPDEQAAAQVDVNLAEIKDPEVSQALAKMKTIDPTFTIHDFITGAKMAFEMIIKAFNEHDRDTLKSLLSKDVYESFEKGMKEQEEKKQRSETTLVALGGAEITEAVVKRSLASVTVQFMSEQIHIVRDADKKIIEGNSSLVDHIVDEWTFERDLKSRNPNWTIVAT